MRLFETGIWELRSLTDPIVCYTQKIINHKKEFGPVLLMVILMGQTVVSAQNL